MAAHARQQQLEEATTSVSFLLLPDLALLPGHPDPGVLHSPPEGLDRAGRVSMETSWDLCRQGTLSRVDGMGPWADGERRPGVGQVGGAGAELGSTPCVSLPAEPALIAGIHSEQIMALPQALAP